MLSFELCKALKGKGFPYKGNKTCYACQDEYGVPNGSCGSHHEVFPYIPSLSELIEACGADLYNITNMGTFWQTNFKDGFAGETAGKTPEEAVANLYLALNSK